MLEGIRLNKRYGKHHSLIDVDFQLKDGECLGVAGHNGSGKSTLLSLVAQVLPPDSGELRCDGKTVLGDRAFLRRFLGYVPQDNGLLDDVSVQETLAFWQKTYGISGDLFAPSSPCVMLGLGELRRKKIAALSGGMRKRLSIALALLHKPRYLLLDEALPALDRAFRQAVHDYLAAFAKQGGGILYCSHEAEDLTAFCGHILVLRNGRKVFDGETADFPRDPLVLDELLNPAENARKGGSHE